MVTTAASYDPCCGAVCRSQPRLPGSRAGVHSLGLSPLAGVWSWLTGVWRLVLRLGEGGPGG